MSPGRGARTAVALALAAGSLIALPGHALALSTTPDITWMTNGKLYASVRLDNTLYVGGTSTLVKAEVPGQAYPVSGLAAFDVTTGQGIPTFAPLVTNSVTGKPIVHSLAVSQDGAWLYVGGNFDAIDGYPFRNFARISTATGQVDPTFAPQVGNTKSFVFAILPSVDKVYIGGRFSIVSGDRRSKMLAAIEPDGTLDTVWRPMADKTVHALAFASDLATIFVGGAFTMVDGAPRQSVARVTIDTGALDTWAIPTGTIVGPQSAWTFAVTPTRLYGGFGYTGPNYLAAFRLDNGVSGNQLWRFNTVGNVQTVALSPAGDRLYFGGHFGLGQLQQRVCGHTYLKGLAIANPVTGELDCSWIPYIQPDNFEGPWSLVLTDTYLWVVGAFSWIGGVKHRDVARFTL